MQNRLAKQARKKQVSQLTVGNSKMTTKALGTPRRKATDHAMA
jgi:hypothetical protein